MWLTLQNLSADLDRISIRGGTKWNLQKYRTLFRQLFLPLFGMLDYVDRLHPHVAVRVHWVCWSAAGWKEIISRFRHYLKRDRSQGLHVKRDVELMDNEGKKGCDVKAYSLISELGRVSYVMSDKTGTLTQNQMRFRWVGKADVHHFLIGKFYDTQINKGWN